MLKDRGAEQGVVDHPLECSLALAWWQWRREEASPHGRRRAPFLGLAFTAWPVGAREALFPAPVLRDLCLVAC